MKKFTIIIAMVLLLASLIVLVDKLFTPQPIQIVLESGQEITTQTANYFSLTETILLLICSFIIGTTATYLFYNSDTFTAIKSIEKEVESLSVKNYDTILPLLKEEEKKVILLLQESQGEILQNKLVLALNLPKVKVTRLLASLEKKNLIIKHRNGLTNNIKLIL